MWSVKEKGRAGKGKKVEKILKKVLTKCSETWYTISVPRRAVLERQLNIEVWQSGACLYCRANFNHIGTTIYYHRITGKRPTQKERKRK